MTTLIQRAIELAEVIATDVKKLKTNTGILESKISSLETINTATNEKPHTFTNDPINTEHNTDSLTSETFLNRITSKNVDNTETTKTFVRDFDGVIRNIVIEVK